MGDNPGQNFWRDRQGSIAIMGGVMLAVMALGVGAAVSYTSAVAYRADLQKAADAAAMAGARPLDVTFAERERIAGAVLTNNSNAERGEILSTGYSESDGAFRIVVDARAPTIFAKLLGQEGLEVQVRSAAARATETLPPPLEIAFVVDATNSMRDIGGQFDDVKQAVVRMVEAVSGGSVNENVTMSLIPYSNRVSLTPDRSAGPEFGETWLTAVPSGTWRSCFEPRERPIGAFDHALDDEPPTTAPFEPSHDGHYVVDHRYDDDQTSGWMACPEMGHPPSHDPDSLNDVAYAMWGEGTGRFDVGLAWGWRALSPRWTGLWELPDYPAAYGEADKKIVWITDGYSTAGEYDFGEFEIAGDRATDASGDRPDEPYLSSSTGALIFGGNQGTEPYFEHVVDLCSRIKATGIEIEVIMTGWNDYAVPYFEQCATDEDMFHLVRDMSQFELSVETVSAGLQPISKPGAPKIIQ